ncbi:MAG: Co2+/Mg2+ efflux protein ApaG [Lysobacter sp.]|nr:Co2+/Mg2+ efflux protein ApaG [Lysobacter sp.]MDQ3270479.1 Co2+/Mg2+ efflux protein ApaG [Pseudomonadota bacterium]
MDHSEHAIDIQVTTRYLDDESEPDKGRFVFAYTIRIHNAGPAAARLLARRWLISDANGKVQQVEGQGVVGEQPWLRPGDRFEYTSGAVLETSVGTMQGHYTMVSDDGTRFDAPVPQFILAVPRTLH